MADISLCRGDRGRKSKLYTIYEVGVTGVPKTSIRGQYMPPPFNEHMKELGVFVGQTLGF